MRRRGFSLLELSITLAISGLMLGFVLKTSNTTGINSAECTASTQMQMQYIRAQIEIFARKNDRLPLPAARNVGVEDVTYGRESSGANIDQIGAGLTGVSFGALPFQALGLPSSYAGDCWGNKFTYAVTTALTTNNTSGGFLDATVPGNITLKRTAATTAGIDVAYAIISHGPDGLGAVKLNYSAANGVNTPPYTGHGWCSGVTLKHLNCNATAAVVADSTYNDGKDSAANYYDDLVITSGRPQILVTSVPTHSWGHNNNGQRGSGALPVIMQTVTPIGVTNWTNIKAGYRHTCGIGDNGLAYCWGDNTYGQLGDGTTTRRAVPTLVPLPSGVTSWTSLSLGTASNAFSSCGIGDNGLAYCWGDNTYNQLGDGTATQRLVPTLVSLPSGVTSWNSISLQWRHACGIGDNGLAYCWGYNVTGEIGDGTTVSKVLPTAVTLPSGVTSFTSITTWNFGGCGIGDNSLTYCWGAASNGAVGDGTNTQRLVPTLVNMTSIPSVTFASTYGGGSNNNCGLGNDGNAYCWGWGINGSLGNGTTTVDQLSPTVVTLPSGVTSFTQMSSGYSWSFAIGDNGLVYYWGSGGILIPTLIGLPSGITAFNAVSAGFAHHCYIGNNGKAYCGGDNTYGQLGTDYSSVPANDIILPGGVTSLSNISAGLNHSCGIGNNGRVYCWGLNSYAQFGNSGNAQSLVPTLSNLPVGVTSFTSVSAGTDHTCFIGDNGRAYCSGRNASGQLGDGSTFQRLVPTLVTLPGGVTSFTSISAGIYHTCGIGNNGRAYCWGNNANNQLGDGTITQRLVPRLVTLPGGVTSFTSIKTGQWHTCGLGNNGRAYCWGLNNNGQVGDGTITQRAVPTLVTLPGGVTSFTSISTGYYHTCGIGNDSLVYCWGMNSSGGSIYTGMIGDTTSVNKLVPTLSILPSGVTNFTKVAAGYYHTCATGNNGRIYCWGSNNYGQLGDNTMSSSLVPIAATHPSSVGNFTNISVGGHHNFAW